MPERIWPDGRPDFMEPVYTESKVGGKILVDCPDCHDPMHLGKIWGELIDDGYEVPKCPGCEPDEWSDDAEPKISGIEVAALASNTSEQSNAEEGDE